MITEDYVSFEAAKLLKSKRFDETCSYEWGIPDVDKGYVLQKWTITNGQIKNSDLLDEAYTAPTHQMALKWLRDNYNIFIGIEINESQNSSYYQYDIVINNNFADAYYDMNNYRLYEDCVDNAIKYCLINYL